MRTLSSILAASLLTITAAFSQTVQVIYSFPADASLGDSPQGTMASGPGGDLYGTTTEGGTTDDGTAFKISTDGAFTSLGSFNKAATGRVPFSRLITIGDGFLYGVAERNTGTSGDPNGTLFKVDPNGGISTIFSLPGSGATPKFPHALLRVTDGSLHVLGSDPGGFWVVPLNGGQATSFDLNSNTVGAFSYSATLGSDGKIYGNCQGTNYVGPPPLSGTLFRIDADGANLTVLHECVAATGVAPHGGMVLASDGNFYGTMSAGGTNSKGCVFRLTPNGDYTVLYHFSTLAAPQGDLIQATDGFLYGTAMTGGGPSNVGGIFRISTAGAFTQLHAFAIADGKYPIGGLVQGVDGNLYGTTSEGGTGGRGAIFRVKLSLPPPNRAPIALDDIGVTTGSQIVINVLGNDFDPEGGTLAVEDVSTPQFGTATILGDNTIQYVPGVNFAGSDVFSYTVSDPLGLITTATVNIQSDPAQGAVFSGAFNGLLSLDPDLAGDTDSPRAQIAVAINDLGKFSGVMLTRRKRVAFRGAFDLTDGTAVVKVNIPGAGKALLFLGFRPDQEATLVAVVYGVEVWSGSARPIIASGLSVTDKHTVVLEAVTSTLPAGYGFGLMQIKPNGLITCAGKHGDGTRLTWGTALVSAPDNAPLIPVFSEPLPGAVCAGVLDSRVVSSFNFVGNLRWIRPPARKATLPYSTGFAGVTVAGSSRFTPTPGLSGILNFGVDGGGEVLLDEGPLAGPIVGSFSIVGPPPPSLRVKSNAPLKVLTINRKTGLITGKMLNGKKPVSFIGVVSQPYNIGFGQFIIGGTSGLFQLTP